MHCYIGRQMNNFHTTPGIKEDLLGDLQKTPHIKQITI
jgi:hypothetical protein